MVDPKLIEVMERLISRPGLLSPLGTKLEKNAQRDLKLYFTNLGRAIAGLELEKLAAVVPEEGGEKQAVRARHFAESKVAGVLRRYSPVLLHILAFNLQQAYIASYKIANFMEASEADKEDTKKKRVAGGTATASTAVEQLSNMGQTAADWAASYSASLVKGINETSQAVLADLVSQGIEDMLSPAELGRVLRQTLDEGWSVSRALMIASTEMNRAMSEGAMAKFEDLGFVEYKQLIISDDACEICQSIADAGPVPLDSPFVDEDGEEYDMTPIHPRCRCATAASRPPVGEEDGA